MRHCSNRATPVWFGLLIALTTAACETSAGPTDLDPAFAMHDGGAIEQTVDVTDFGPNVIGTATVVRNRGGITIRVSMDDVPAGTYTVWGASFGAPENCVGGCDGGDFNDAAQGGLNRVLGRVVGSDGPATFSGRLAAGALRDNLAGGPLQNPLGAELHLILRYHGPKIPGLVDDQIHTAGAACPCADIALAVVLPPA